MPARSRPRRRRGDRALRDRPRGADADERMSADRRDLGRGPRHRRLRRRPGDRDPRRRPATRSPPTTRCSRSSPTRRRWTSRRRSPGVVQELLVKVGDTVSQGTPLLTMLALRRGRRGRCREGLRGGLRRPPTEAAAPDAAAREPRLAAERGPRGPEPAATAPPSLPAPTATGPVYASPSVRRLARELGVDLARRHRQRPQGPDHASEDVERDRHQRAGTGCAGRPGFGPRAGALAVARLREVRSGRARAALADPEDLGAEPRPQLGDDPARHAQRRGGHHRARGVAQAAQRRARREA